MNNPEDQNPLLPNLRDEAIERMMRLVFLWFYLFVLAAAVIIAWFIFSVTRPAKPQPKFGDMPMLWTNGVEYVEITNASSQTEFYVSYYPKRWLSFTYPDNNPHWTNVVFSSTREPVVTKTNGEWRITFR